MGWLNEHVAMLIEEYEKHPCLYEVKHRDYHNKCLRSSALTEITNNLRVVLPLVTEAEVQKKFMGLRTTYGNERKKMLTAVHSGMGEDEVYKPSLWYFRKMLFLNESLELERISPRPLLLNVLLGRLKKLASRSKIFPLTVDVDEGEYTIEDDGSLSRFPDSEGMPVKIPSTSRASSQTPSTSRESNQSPTIISQASSRQSKRKRDNNNGNKTTNSEDEMIMLNKVGKNLESLGSVVYGSGSTRQKQPEDIFGEFVATQLKKNDNEEEKNEVQYAIHGILRNSLRKKKS